MLITLSILAYLLLCLVLSRVIGVALRNSAKRYREDGQPGEIPVSGKRREP